ncbi:unnamed protein product [Linum trigynum]|uniref:Uncharacterized protein n=1 Tax=Linum trigynum TaxID=586398 RepID=A0AAV2EDR7_9ROSI
MKNQVQNNYPSAAPPPRRSFSMNPNDMFHGSLVGFAPPPPFFSSYLPTNSSAALSNFYYHHQQEPAHLAAAPPLLPLPAAAPIGRPHHGSLPSYKSAPAAKKPGRGARKPKKPAKRSDEPKPLMPYNNNNNKDVSKVPPAVKEIPVLSLADELLISMLAPPPSSLPLPRFSLRPKRLMMTMSSCTAEAAVNDNGTADSLRQMLRLR